MNNRTSYHPAFYRVMFQTVAGWVSRDTRSLEKARRIAKAEAGPWGRPYILACWYRTGRSALDTERVS